MGSEHALRALGRRARPGLVMSQWWIWFIAARPARNLPSQIARCARHAAADPAPPTPLPATPARRLRSRTPPFQLISQPPSLLRPGACTILPRHRSIAARGLLCGAQPRLLLRPLNVLLECCNHLGHFDAGYLQLPERARRVRLRGSHHGLLVRHHVL
jgi:hypothetical protein